MNIDFSLDHGVALAKPLDRRLDASGAADFKSRVGSHIEGGSRCLVLDLSAVEFIDSTGLSSILSILRRLAPDGTLGLAGCTKQIVELIKLTRLDRVLRLFPNTEEAVQALANGNSH